MEASVSYCHIQHFHEKNSVYTCGVYKSDLSNVTSFSGLHSPDFCDDDVRGVSLVNCKLSSFPRELSKVFPNLDHLAINGGLREITKEDLACFKNLKFLDLQGCNITALPDNLFEDSPDIELVYFSFNKIISIGENILKPLRSLKYIDFRGNLNINAVYDADNTSELSLEELKRLIRTRGRFHDDLAINTKPIRAECIYIRD